MNNCKKCYFWSLHDKNHETNFGYCSNDKFHQSIFSYCEKSLIKSAENFCCKFFISPEEFSITRETMELFESFGTLDEDTDKFLLEVGKRLRLGDKDLEKGLFYLSYREDFGYSPEEKIIFLEALVAQVERHESIHVKAIEKALESSDDLIIFAGIANGDCLENRYRSDIADKIKELNLQNHEEEDIRRISKEFISQHGAV